MSNAMKTEARIAWPTGLILVLAAYFAQPLQAQEEEGIGQALEDCRRNIRSSPIEGQRFCRDVLRKIEDVEFAEEYRQEKTEAFSLLGESYYREGRIAEAEANLDSVIRRTPEGHPKREKAESYTDDIARLFHPLKITIKDRLIPRLAYIKGLDREIRYPKRLERAQIKRVQILQDERGASEDEFQFVGVDSTTGQAYLEIDYFPVTTFEGETFGFSLIVEGNRRYRFSHTADSDKPLEIYWEEDAGWELIERVPDGMVKLEVPGQYEFSVTSSMAGEQALPLPDGETQHIYISAGTQVELKLQGSEGRAWERVYEVVAYGVTGLAGWIAVFGAR